MSHWESLVDKEEDHPLSVIRIPDWNCLDAQTHHDQKVGKCLWNQNGNAWMEEKVLYQCSQDQGEFHFGRR